MSKRVDTSLVVIVGDELIRADVRGADVVTYRGVRPEVVDDLSLLVEATLALGPQPGRKVCVLASEQWTQVVELPRASTRGLSTPELEQALLFEAEALSGMSALDSSLGFCPLSDRGGERRFWVTQLPRAELDGVRGVLEERGLKLSGVSHPACLPVSLNGTPPGGGWQRLDLWPGLQVDLARDAAGLDVTVEPSDAVAQEELLGETEHELLLAPGLGLAPRGEHAVDLSEPATFERWAVSWTKALNDGSAPVVRPPASPVSSSVWIALSVLLAVVTATICWGHTSFVAARTVELEGELKALKRAGAASSEVARQQATLEREINGLTQALGQVETTLQDQRCRTADLLGALASAPGGIVLERIEDDGRKVTVSGVAPDPELPSRLATGLAQGLDAHGWRMAPPQASLIDTAEGPRWRFTLVLEDPRSQRGATRTAATKGHTPGRVRRPGTRGDRR